MFIEHGSRRMHLGGVTANPPASGPCSRPQPGPQPRRAVRGHQVPAPRPLLELHLLVRRRLPGHRHHDPAQRCPGAADERDLRAPRRTLRQGRSGRWCRLLAGHANGHRPLLQLRGLIEYKDRVKVAKVGQDEPLQPIQHHLPVPGVLGQQRLHPPVRGVLGLLAQLPARLAVPGHCQRRRRVRERRKTRPGLREHRGDQRAQFRQQFPWPGPGPLTWPRRPPHVDLALSRLHDLGVRCPA